MTPAGLSTLIKPDHADGGALKWGKLWMAIIRAHSGHVVFHDFDFAKGGVERCQRGP